jgi:glutamate carboxypeptidase
VAAFVVLPGAAPVHAELDATEQAIRESVYARGDLMADTLRTWVDLNTGTWNRTGVVAFAALLVEELRALGFHVKVQEGPELHLPGQPSMLAGPIVIARHASSEEIESPARLLLIAHLDTVFEPDSPFQRFETDRNDPDRATGPGVIDMKGGLIVMLEALRALRDVGELDRAAITVLLDSDEETGSLGSRAVIEAEARDADYGLVFEPARQSGAMVGSRRGLGQFHVAVQGVAAHAGSAHEQGRSAIRELSEKVVRIEALTDYARGVTVNVGTFHGGSKRNIVPAEAESWIDVRFDDPEIGEEVKGAIEEIAGQTFVEGTTTTVWGRLHRPPKPETEGVRALLEIHAGIARDLGVEMPPPESSGGGTDGSLAAAQGLPTLDSLGAVGGAAHTEREFVRLSSLPERAVMAAILVRRLSAKPAGSAP